MQPPVSKSSIKINPSFFGSKPIFPPNKGLIICMDPKFDYSQDRKPEDRLKVLYGLTT
jgi:hypothetical protein